MSRNMTMNILTKKITRGKMHVFLKQYATSEKVLDVGAGSQSGAFKDLFPHTVTVDIKPERKPDIVGDIHNLPIKDNAYDVILCTEVLEHTHTPEKAVSELYRVLKPQGTLILTTRFIFPIHDYEHDYFRFTYQGMRHLFRNFEIMELVEEVDTQGTLAILLQRVSYQTDTNKIIKLFLLIIAFILSRLPAFTNAEYAEITRTNKLNGSIMASGYYIACNKR